MTCVEKVFFVGRLFVFLVSFLELFFCVSSAAFALTY